MSRCWFQQRQRGKAPAALRQWQALLPWTPRWRNGTRCARDDRRRLVHRRHQPRGGRWVAPNNRACIMTRTQPAERRHRYSTQRCQPRTSARDPPGGTPLAGRQPKRQQCQRPRERQPYRPHYERADWTQHAVADREANRGQQPADRATQSCYRRPGERRRRGQTGKHRSEHRQRCQHRGKPRSHAAQPAARCDPPSPRKHREPWQRCRQPEALQQQVRQHGTDRPGQVAGRARGRCVQRWVAWIVAGERHEQCEAQ